MKKGMFLMLILMVFFSCRKGTKYSNIPKIRFLSLSDSVFKASTEKKIMLNFSFEDGDGDIAFGTKNLFLIDSRNMLDTQKYPIPDIPARFITANGLAGLITLESNGAYLALRTDPLHLKSDTLTWFLLLKDKADNQSNIIRTNRIIIRDSL
jgi:hypothetical protein